MVNNMKWSKEKIYFIIAMIALTGMLIGQVEVIKVKMAYNDLVDEANLCLIQQEQEDKGLGWLEPSDYNWSKSYHG